jgi:tripartite-type tricarboxylate transporter receptor subunit TctC
LVAQKLGGCLRQQVIVDNRPGAGGNVGAEAAARAPGDGYTMFLAGVASHGINPNLRKKLPYEPIRDFDAVSLIASAPLLVLVHPSLPVKSVKDLVAFAKRGRARSTTRRTDRAAHRISPAGSST